MSENTTNNRNVRDDEIDLLDLFRRMGRALTRWLNALGRAFLISVVFIIKRWIPLTSSIILGLIVSYISIKSTASLYSSDLVLRNNAIPNDQMISYINRLKSLDKASLSRTLGISEATSKNISFIEAYWIIDLNKDEIPDFVDYTNTHNVYDTTNIRMPDRVNINIKIISPQDLAVVREGIVKYIENEPAFQRMNSLRLNQAKAILDRIDIDIHNLDSLQRVKYFEEPRGKISKANGQIVFMQEQPAQLFYRDILHLYERKQKIEEENDLYSSIVSVLSDFTVPTKRFNSLDYYAQRYVPSIFAVVLIFLIIFAQRKKLGEVYDKYK